MRKEQIFTGITSQGGLLPADFLAALSDPKSGIDGLDPVTFRLAPGERLGEQVNRSWNRLKGCWVNFQRALANKEPGDPTTSETRERWLLPLFQELDFGRLAAVKPLEIDGRSYAVSHGWGPVPIHLVGSHVELDRRTPGAVGAAKASPHSLVQQVLNASDDHLWGIISNGFIFRLLRDNLALTRQAYVEWDLQAIFDGDLYPEFFLLWVVCHQSRFEVPPGSRPEQCWLEKWRKQAEDTGLRALEHLRPGVEQAIAALGTGLISHKSNQALREKLSSGALSTQDFYRQILRLIYRLLFLLVAEDRNLLHPPLPSEDAGKDALDRAIQARRRYHEFYSISRLRSLTRRRAGTPHPDLWQVFQFVTRKLGSEVGCPELALPALGSFLWNAESTPDLNQCLVSNRHFLEAVLSLAYIRDGDVRRTIDYKNLGSEELGSVYESLLELHPRVNADAGTFELSTAAGHERKTSGSYYTPDSLVQCLLDSALEPVMAEAVKGKEGAVAAEALLKLKICDPAVGSGHFLIAAAHRLAKKVAATRTGEEEPSPEATRTALRDVTGRCLYGVDINPMAAELCKVSLWLEALEPGKPLSFLNHHIRVGNSLLGATPGLITAGLPDDAFNFKEGDDKEACTILKKRNKAERKGFGPLFAQQNMETQARLQQVAALLEELPDDRLEDIHTKERAFHDQQETEEHRHKNQLADAWCAAFVIQKHFSQPGKENSVFGITHGLLTRLAAYSTFAEERPIIDETVRLAESYLFFHWHLAFPEVFSKGGFDVVLCNPPWERIKIEERVWFELRAPHVASAANADQRKIQIANLIVEQPQLWREFQEALQRASRIAALISASGLFPLGAAGDLNTFSVFADLCLRIINATGRTGFVAPTSLLTDYTYKDFFGHVMSNNLLRRVVDLSNKNSLFPAVDSNQKFSLITLGQGYELPCFSFGLVSPDQAREVQNSIYITPDDIRLVNPNTATCPAFQSTGDAGLVKLLYRRVPILKCEGTQSQDEWDLDMWTMFHMANDSRLFFDSEKEHDEGKDCIGFSRLYEGKMINQFDHRYSNAGKPAKDSGIRGTADHLTDSDKQNPECYATSRYLVSSEEVKKRAHGFDWFIGYREIAGAVANIRTMSAAIIPQVGVGNKILLFGLKKSTQRPMAACLLANLNSFVFDYILRQKMTGTSLSFYIVKQIPSLPPTLFKHRFEWVCEAELFKWIEPRVLELSYTAWDLESFAKDSAWFGPPFHWDEERRFLIRCELDAAFLHLYLMAGKNGDWHIVEGETPEDMMRLKQTFFTPRDAVAYILDSFPIVCRKDIARHGEFRTKRVILEIYDKMQESIRTGQTYQTRLAPPPADPHCCHPPKKYGDT